jgi:hypothetical protein
VTGVSLHEPLTNLQPVIIVQFADSTPSTEIWRALHGAMSFQLFCGKIVIAVDDDIDPVTATRSDVRGENDSSRLIDATRKGSMPPLSPQPPWHGYAMGIWSKGLGRSGRPHCNRCLRRERRAHCQTSAQVCASRDSR